EDLRAEEPVPLRLEGAVVDRLGLLHLAVRPLADLLRAGERDPDRAERERVLRLLEEIENVLHVLAPSKVSTETAAAWLTSLCLTRPPFPSSAVLPPQRARAAPPSARRPGRATAAP